MAEVTVGMSCPSGHSSHLVGGKRLGCGGAQDERLQDTFRV